MQWQSGIHVVDDKNCIDGRGHVSRSGTLRSNPDGMVVAAECLLCQYPIRRVNADWCLWIVREEP